jgi:hypothetical protein
MQRYEAGSTIYGPYTLDAYIQLFSQVAEALATGPSLRVCALLCCDVRCEPECVLTPAMHRRTAPPRPQSPESAAKPDPAAAQCHQRHHSRRQGRSVCVLQTHACVLTVMCMQSFGQVEFEPNLDYKYVYHAVLVLCVLMHGLFAGSTTRQRSAPITQTPPLVGSHSFCR